MSKGKEHIIPANLGCHDVLPSGVVCDRCNNHFSKMDNSILLNRWIALHVGTRQIPGRRGKPRLSIGERIHFPQRDHFVLMLGPVAVSSGTKQGTLAVQQSGQFDECLFARGIHKAALNCCAARFGQTEVLQGRFDSVRKYVKFADIGEFWPYGVLSGSRDERLWAVLHRSRRGLVVELHLLCLDFLISLEGWNRDLESRLNEKWTIVRGPGQWNESSLLGLKLGNES
jgi:hypothetical protein